MGSYKLQLITVTSGLRLYLEQSQMFVKHLMPVAVKSLNLHRRLTKRP